ncbi:MAG: preprotein translocase subunit SecY [Candidatus Paceibacterota bacterium]
MIGHITQIFKTKDLRNKFIFVLAMMAIFRLMASIPVPGVDISLITKFFASGQNSAFGFLNMILGGGLENLSLVMLGMGPYITASIIFQLLGMIIPSIEEMMKEGGEAGRKTINQWSRLATVPLALLQGWAMIKLFQTQGLIPNLPLSVLISALISIAAGSVVVMFLGELISEKGIGDGVSLLIFAGIVSRLPNGIYNQIILFDASNLSSILNMAVFALISIAMIGLVVSINEARRNITVSYAKQVRGNKMFGGVTTYLPLSVNPTGVIPVIFAVSFMVIPGAIFQLLARIPSMKGLEGVSEFFARTFTSFPYWGPIPGAVWGAGLYDLIYFLLVFFFTYFYAAVVFNPKDIADNLQKTGGFVPGIRPGENTAKYIDTTLNRLLLVGAAFLGFIAIAPSIVGSLTQIQGFDFLVGGTSLLIVVSVVMDTIKKVNAQLQMRDYETI